MPDAIIIVGLSAALAAFVLFHAFIRPSSRLARRTGRVDYESSLKGYRSYVPLGGGMALFWSWALSVAGLSVFGFWAHGIVGFLAGGLLIHWIGLLRDGRRIHRGLAELGTLAGCIITVLFAGDALLPTVTLPAIAETLPAVSVYLGITAGAFWLWTWSYVVASTDRADGLLGITVVNALLWLIAAAFIGQSAFDGANTLLLAGLPLTAAMIAFLQYNLRRPRRPKALVYMGCSGNAFAGFLVGVVSLVFVLSQADVLRALIVPASLVALPFTDAFGTLWRRFRNRTSVRELDIRTLHQLIVARGVSESKAVAIQTAILFCVAAMGVALWWSPVQAHYQWAALAAVVAVKIMWSSVSWRQIGARSPALRILSHEDMS